MTKRPSAALTGSLNAGNKFSKRNADHLEKIAQSKLEANQLAGLESQRFAEARRRLKSFVTASDMSDGIERGRLLAYFSHRYASMIQLLKESIRTRRLNKGKLADV